MVDAAARDPSPERLGALVGRDDALALALRRWETTQRGIGHLLLVSGEAGIGKSRLMVEFGATVSADTAIVNAGAFPRDTEAAGGLILGISGGLRRVGLSAAGAALRARLLAVDDSGDAARRRRILVGDLADILLELGDEPPVLIRLEDLHWADDLSLDVLERMSTFLPTRPLMVIATYRSDELVPGSWLGRWRARLLERRSAEEVRLPRLTAGEVAALVESITGRVPSSNFIASLHRRSDGIPLHIEELLAAGSADSIPNTVAEAVGLRAAALDGTTLGVLQAGAAIGREFSIDLLGVAAEQPAEVVDCALSRLVAARLAIPVGDDGTFVFRHALICDAVYHEIPPFRKRALHASIALAAESAGMGEAYISEQFERAQDAGHAYQHALAGAAQAVRISAHREAAKLLRRAQRTAPASVGPAARATLHANLASELAAIDDNEAAASNLLSAIDLHRRRGDQVAAAALVPALMNARHLLGARLDERASLATDALGRLPSDTTDLVRAQILGALAAAYMLDRRLDESLEFGCRAATLAISDVAIATDIDITLGVVHVFTGHGDEGWPLLETAIASSEDAGMEAAAARGYRMLGSSASVLVDYRRAIEWIEAGLRFTEKSERWNDHHYLLAHLGHVRWALGERAASVLAARRALADGRGITTRITALIVTGYLALDRRDFGGALTALTEALELGDRMRELQSVSPALWGLAEIALRTGDATLATELCERGFAESDRVSDAASLFPFVVTGTRALLDQREPRLARLWIERCRRPLDGRRIPGTLPALDHAGGLVELFEGHTGAARTLLERASKGWTASGRRWEGDQLLVDLARCAARSRRPAEAGRLIDLALARAETTESELLARLAASVTTTSAAGVLSARELEVARLIAEGRTNRQIAERLTISPKTAATHVEHILAKLGASRRAEIATWVTRHG